MQYYKFGSSVGDGIDVTGLSYEDNWRGALFNQYDLVRLDRHGVGEFCTNAVGKYLPVA